MRNLFTCFLLLCMVPGSALAQHRVSGQVTDVLTSGGIPGVTVMIKGTATATQTDAVGNYAIDADPTDTLVFRSLGYALQEMPISNQTTINVVLETEGTELDEVVVIGYGTQRQRELTTAVTTVRADDIAKTPNAQPMQALITGM